MKTYLVLADSRQLKKSKGETVELPPAAAKYLVAAGVLEEVSAPVELPADGPTEGAASDDAGPAEQPSPRRKRD